MGNMKLVALVIALLTIKRQLFFRMGKISIGKLSGKRKHEWKQAKQIHQTGEVSRNLCHL